MKYCPKCGRQLVDEAVICVSCGCAQSRRWFGNREDSSSFGWGVLGFFVPLLGLILYLLWKDATPKKAKSVGIGAIIGAVVGVLIAILVCVIYGLLIGMMFGAPFAY
ncbi:MAG: zinc ribbon domain-containing protein [Ruminococcaceae bacterium]|nr:zinc ribbon domain-containing protein [Oscillospiraceae bacterium]